jgi:vanillate O-demethylase monooxygenase subunit
MRSAWYPVLLTKELKPDALQAMKIFGDPVVIFRAEDGRPTCVLDSCPHRGIPFSLGRVAKGRLECAYHGWQYGGDGRCALVPLMPPGKSIPQTAVARTYPTTESGGAVWVWPGDPREADLKLLPLPFRDCSGHKHTHSITTFFESRYDLVIDHGLDMPHFFHAHARTLGLVLREMRADALLSAGRPVLDTLEETEQTFTAKWRFARPGGDAIITTEVFHPCNVSTTLPIDLTGRWSLRQVFFFTPLDERRTRGFLFAHRNFLTQPIIGHVLDSVYEWVMARARGEDDAIFQGQLANEALGAKSATSWPYDVVSTRYQKWQRRRSGEDLWFSDLHHAYSRYAGESAA